MNTFPKLRFPEFRDGWRNYRFDEYFDISAGGDIEKNQVQSLRSEAFPYPIYSNTELNAGLYGFAAEYRQESDCVTVTGRGTLGIAIARKEKFYPIVRLLVLRPKQRSNVDFLENAINRIKFAIESTGVPQLTGPQIGSYRIHLPSYEEQQKIADFLTAVDEKIAAIKKKKELLEQYKKGAMQAIFNQRIRFRDASGNPYPEWEEKKLGEITSIRTGKKDVNQGNVLGKYPFFTCAKEHTYSDTYSFSGDAILIAGNGEVGLCTFYTGQFEAYQRTYVLQDFKENAQYVFKYLDNYFSEFVHGQKQMGAMPYIKLGMIQNYKIPIPSEKEQQKISNFLTALDDRINAEDKKLERAQQFKKALLQQMFV